MLCNFHVNTLTRGGQGRGFLETNLWRPTDRPTDQHEWTILLASRPNDQHLFLIIATARPNHHYQNRVIQAVSYVGLICLPRMSVKTKRVHVIALGRRVIPLARAVRVNSLRTAAACGAHMSVMRLANRGPEHNARATQARVWKSTVTVQ